MTELHGSLTVTRAVDEAGQEWVPLDEYRRLEAEYECLRPMIVNPRRNVLRALRALAESRDEKRARYLLDHALEELDAAYETAFPPPVLPSSREDR